MLLIAAALLHACWNLVTKKAGAGLIFFWLVSFAASILCLPVIIWQMVREPFAFNNTILMFAFVSGILHILYYVVLQLGYSKSDLSVVYPVARGTGPLLSVTGAVLLFHEKPGLTGFAGIICIMVGIAIMTGFKKGQKGILTGIYYGALTGLFIASYTLWDKSAVADHNVSALFITFAAMVLPMLFLLHVPIKKGAAIVADIRLHWKNVLIVAICQPLSYILVLIAMKTTPLSYVAPVRELSIVFGVFFGINLLKEADKIRRIIAACIIFAGIALLAWS
jgi:drug/metabolite transporter (DMT)-like permease